MSLAPTEVPAPTPTETKPGPIRRLYDWVLSWEQSRYALPALFVLAFAESSFFPIPPDVLLLALAMSAPTRAFRFAWVCSLGSVFGGVAGYGIGYFMWTSVDTWFYQYVPGFTAGGYDYVAGLYDAYNFWIVFTAGFTPIPYKLITLTAGACAINFPMFAIASIVGRSARFFLVAALVKRFGPPIKILIDKYFNLFAFAFVALLIGGFAVIKLLLH